MDEKVSLKEHPSIIRYLKPYDFITMPVGYKRADPIFADIDSIHETHIDKQIINKLLTDRILYFKKWLDDGMCNDTVGICKVQTSMKLLKELKLSLLVGYKKPKGPSLDKETLTEEINKLLKEHVGHNTFDWNNGFQFAMDELIKRFKLK